MKKFTLLRAFTLLTGLLFLTMNGWGQTELLINGDFESWDNSTTPTGWDHIESITQESVEIHGGIYSAKHIGGTKDLGQYINVIGGNSYTITIWYKITAGDGTDARIWSYWRSGGSNLTDNANELRGPNNSYFDTNGGIWTEYTVTLDAPATADEFYFEVRTYSGATVFWDDFSFLENSSTDPAITIIPSSLTGFTYLEGNGPSVEQSFTVEGSNLTADIAVTPPTDYEISETSGSGFTGSAITLTQSGGTVNSTTIYVRLKAGLSAGIYDEDVTCSSTDATDKTVSCSGTVEAPATTTLPFIETFDANLGDCYTYSVSGNTKVWIWNSGGTAEMNGYISGDIEEDWLILPGINLDNYEDEVLTFETWFQYGDEDINNYLKLFYSTDYSGIGDPSTATWVELVFTKPASDQTWTFSSNIDLSTISGTSVWIAFKYRDEPTNYRWWQIDNINIFEATTPMLTADPATLTGFTYVEGFGPSASQSFSASGLSLDPADGNITVTGSTNYEVSDDDITFSGSVLLPYTGGELAATNVYVRLKAGLAEGTYNSETIAITGGGATQVDVTVSGEVTAPPPGLPYVEDFSGFVSAETIPDGWIVSNETYLGDWGSGTGGGLRGNANVLGFQHTSSTGIFTATLTLINNTGETIEELFISYMGMVERVAEGRSPEWTVELNDVVIPDLFYSTVDGVDKNVSTLIQGLSIANNEIFTIKWSSDRGLPEGSSKQIGIGDVEVSRANTFVMIGAADDASNYATWIDNSNEGYGFGPWALSSGIDVGGNAGFFLGDPATAGISNMDNPSFGLYANPAGNNFANADRDFISPLGAGSTFSVVWGVNWDSDGAGNKGLNLYSGGISGTEIININMGGSAVITINGNPMFNNYGTNAMTLYFEYISEGQLRVYGTGRDGSEVYDQTLAVAGAPDAVRFYASGLAAGDQRQPYFNNLAITTEPSTIPVDATLFVKGQVELNTNLEVENLIIETGQFLQINPNVNLTVNGTLNNDNAGSKSESGLLIKSDATGTGSLIHSTSDVDATVERYIIAANWADSTSGYHLISSPVSGQAIDLGWTPSGLDGDYDFYAWNEPGQIWLNQKVGGNNITEFEVGIGYLAAYEQSGTKEFTGLLNVNDVVVSVTQSGAPAENNHYGFNMVGNPFASAIDWEHASWTLTNIGGVAKVWSNGVYDDIEGPNAIIPSMNGFFVFAGAATASLTIPAAARVHDAQAWYKSGSDNRIVLAAGAVNGNIEQRSIVKFNPAATTGFDLEYDAYFMAGYAPLFYSKAEGKSLSTNTLPEINAGLSIPFGFVKNSSNSFYIEMKESIEDAIVYLTDLKLNSTHNLTDNPIYEFSAGTDDNPHRFKLSFETVGIPGIPAREVLNAYSYANIIYVMSSGNSKALVEVYNIQGQVIMSHEIGKGLQSLPVKVAPGAYIVRMISEGETATRKIVIQ